MTPVLIGCAHGTRLAEGQETIRQVLGQVQDHLGVEVREAYVDVQEPTIEDVVTSIPQSPHELSGVVVPLLLAGGYHVHVDIAKAVKNRPDVPAAPPLGPDPRLIEIVLERLEQAGAVPGSAVVLAAAGSSDPRSQADTHQAADMLRERWTGPVTIGYAAGPTPSVSQAVSAVRDSGYRGEVTVASYLLAPGLFQRRLIAAGADRVSAPLAPHPTLIEIIASRYREACRP